MSYPVVNSGKTIGVVGISMEVGVVDEIASASSNLADMAQDMSEMISKFKL